MKPLIIIGYSGHAFVVVDIFLSMQREVVAYCDVLYKENNPFGLTYLGTEDNADALLRLKISDYFISIGDNDIRRKLQDKIFKTLEKKPTNAIHSSAILSKKIVLETGIMIGANAVVNAMAKIGAGTILNTACIVEHECEIGDFCHIAPHATLCGNVVVGENTFIGAGAVIKQGVKIGKNVVIGAGTVVIRDIADHTRLVGNPAKPL